MSKNKNHPLEYQRAKLAFDYIAVRLPHSESRLLRSIAAEKRVSLIELIRTYICWGIEEEKKNHGI